MNRGAVFAALLPVFIGSLVFMLAVLVVAAFVLLSVDMARNIRVLRYRLN